MTAMTELRDSSDLMTALCRELISLACQEEQTAAEEAARTPYWSPCPPSVLGHRQAAVALRDTVARLEAGPRG